MENDELFDKANDAIQEIFSDTSVSPDETKARLEGLRDKINENLSALADDASRETPEVVETEGDKQPGDVRPSD